MINNYATTLKSLQRYGKSGFYRVDKDLYVTLQHDKLCYYHEHRLLLTLGKDNVFEVQHEDPDRRDCIRMSYVTGTYFTLMKSRYRNHKQTTRWCNNVPWHTGAQLYPVTRGMRLKHGLINPEICIDYVRRTNRAMAKKANEEFLRPLLAVYTTLIKLAEPSPRLSGWDEMTRNRLKVEKMVSTMSSSTNLGTLANAMFLSHSIPRAAAPGKVKNMLFKALNIYYYQPVTKGVK